MSKKKSSNKKVLGIAAIILAIVLIVFIILFALDVNGIRTRLFNKVQDVYNEYTKLYYNDSPDDDPEGTIALSSEPVKEGDKSQISTSQFSIHFLELGNKYAGDCTLIKCGNTEVLIDAGSRTNSATVIKDYVDQYCTDGKLEYVIATHAHQDHIAGFVGTGSKEPKTGILYQYKVDTIIQFAGHNSTAAVYNNYCKAVRYAEDMGATTFTAKECWYEEKEGAKKSYDISEAKDGSLTLNVVYNYYYENQTSDENDYSVCVLLSYTPATGKAQHYLFTGDLEGEGEKRMVDYYEKTDGVSLPQVELFKGAHHGSKTSSTDKLLSVIKPKRVAVCCCAGATEYTTNNDNTFPTQAFVDRISAYTDAVYCTTLCVDYKGGKFKPMNGNIVFYVKEDDLKTWCSNSLDKLKEWDWFKTNRTCPASWK